MKFRYRIDDEGINEFLDLLKGRMNKIYWGLYAFGCFIITMYGVLSTVGRNKSSGYVTSIWGIVILAYGIFYLAKYLGIKRGLAVQKEKMKNQIQVTYHTDSVDFEGELLEDRIVIQGTDYKREYFLTDVSYYVVREKNIYIFLKGSLVIYALKSTMENPTEFENILSKHAPKDKPVKLNTQI